MSRVLFGVIGHVDHGKTALVRALTGMETDRLPEERRRGMSISLGFAHAGIDGDEIDFIDMPGHERFVRTLVSGATGIDAALLVVAADEGVKPQTREHVDIAALLGVRRTVIAVTKADRADPAAAAAAASALAARAGLRAEPPVAVSALSGDGLEALRAALVRATREVEAPRDRGAPWLPVDRAFLAEGHGVVVTGTLQGGRLARGDALEVVPGGAAVRVRGLQVHGRAVESAAPGSRVAVNLRGADLAEVGRGDALATPGRFAPSRWLSVALGVPADAVELRTGARLQLLVGTAEVAVRLRLLAGDVLAPGATAPVQLHAETPVCAPAGARFVLRLPSPAATVAGGRVLDPSAPRLRRRDPVELSFLEGLARTEDAARLAHVLDRAGAQGVSLERLAQLAGAGPAQAAQMLKGLPVERTGAGGAVSRAALEAVTARALAALGRGPLPLARLKAEAGAGEEVLAEAVGRLASAGGVRTDGGVVRVVHAEAEHARADSDAALATRLAEALRRGGLQPPEAAPADASRELRRALDRLVREHVVVRTYDRVQKREVVFHREAVETARRTLRPHLTGEGLLVKEAGALLGVSRKYAVPLLEHLDAVQFTRRVGDRRTLGAGAAAC